MSLEKRVSAEYNSNRRFVIGDLPKSTSPPGQSDPEIGSAPGASRTLAWKNMSLRHVPLRGTGWSRNPTSSGVAQRNRNQRVRRRPLLQPHEKTIGTFRTHAFLASKENGFITRTITPACSGSVQRGKLF